MFWKKPKEEVKKEPKVVYIMDFKLQKQWLDMHPVEAAMWMEVERVCNNLAQRISKLEAK